MKLVVDIGMKYPQITGPVADAFSSELDKLTAAEEFTDLVLDFEGTQVLSSMAMASLLAMRQKLREQNRELRLINVSDRVSRLLRMVNMDDILV